MSTSAWNTSQAKCKLISSTPLSGVLDRSFACTWWTLANVPSVAPHEPHETHEQRADSYPSHLSRCSKRVEAQLTDLEAKLEAKKMELVHLQTQQQQKAQQEADAAAPPTAKTVAAAAV